MEFRSTGLLPNAKLATRRPFNNTSVYLEPRPRRLAVEAPPVAPTLLATTLPPKLAAMFWTRSCTVVAPLRAMSSLVTVEIGSEVSAETRLMLEPVTSMRSSFWVSWASTLVAANARIALVMVVILNIETPDETGGPSRSRDGADPDGVNPWPERMAQIWSAESLSGHNMPPPPGNAPRPIDTQRKSLIQKDSSTHPPLE